MAATAINPILPGFHPDPSICRVGDDFYLVTSTFEYFPGLPLHTSRDLAHWSLIGHVLDRPSQLPLQGVRASGGLYAPTIRWHDGVFYVVCTLVDGVTQDGNFVVTATAAAGPWSEPTWLGAPESFDPSLLFDGDDAWFCATRPRADAKIAGQNEVWVQRFDPTNQTLVGEQQVIWHGALVDAVWAEAPHLYAVEGGYLLVIAEGGTAENHAVTCARASSVLGPYENCPRNPILTHRHLGLSHPVIAAGHADLIEAADGTWWSVSLAIRPRPDAHGNRHANLGRETFLASVSWEEGWPVVNPGYGALRREQPALEHKPPAQTEALKRDGFDSESLDPVWRFLRAPLADLDARPGHLALNLLPGKLGDRGETAFVCRPQDAWTFTVSTVIDVDLADDNEAAGLALRQTDDYSLQLLVCRQPDGSRVARAVTRAAGVERVDGEVALPAGPIELGVMGDGLDYRMIADGIEVAVLDGRTLSTEMAGGFTGAMLGPYATSNGIDSTTTAYYGWFDYERIENAW
jgi:xylan 1,4-beta-xylosidase